MCEPCFTWLHLTDLHVGMKEQNWLWQNVKERFFEDLKKLHDKSGTWDLVLFTGDLTQQGSREDFEKVDEIFEKLWELFKELGSEPKLLAVPGNHDLVRPDEKVKKEPSFILLNQWEQQKDIQEIFWDDSQSSYLQIVNKAFENYNNWWKNQPFKPDNINAGMLPGDFSFTLEKDGAKLGIIGLNTAFLQLTGDNYEGKLALHTHQFHKSCKRKDEKTGDGPAWVKQHHACLFMTHHPPAWLNTESQQHLNGEITAYGHFAVHLCGHLHKTSYSASSWGGTETRRIWQARSLFGLEYYGDKEDRQHGYTVGKIKIKENQGELLFYPRESRVLSGGQREIIPDYSSVKLTDEQHTEIENFELHQHWSYVSHNSENAQSSSINEEVDEINEIEEVQIEFVNRTDELKDITKTHPPPYLLISAPMGYGKTRLMKAIKAKLEKDYYYCVYVTLSRDKKYSIKGLIHKILKELEKEDNIEKFDLNDSKSCGRNIGLSILNKLGGLRKKFVILVDEAESLGDDLLDQIFQDIIPSIFKQLKRSDVKFRVIFSGRYISNWDLKLRTIEIKTLSPFNYDSVFKTVERFHANEKCSFSNNELEKWASYLMYITCGHPKCITDILIKYFFERDIDEMIDQEVYKDIIEPVINNIKKGMPDDMRRIFPYLSIIRLNHTEILQKLINEQIIVWKKSASKLKELLCQSFLVSRGEKEFFKDGITRQLLADSLCRSPETRQLFIKISELSISYYWNYLENSQKQIPDAVAVELLFQKMQILRCKQENNEPFDKDEIFKKLKKILDLLRSKHAASILEDFKNRLKEDYEFRFNYNYMFRNEIYNNDYPFNELIEEITKYINMLEEEENV